MQDTSSTANHRRPDAAGPTVVSGLDPKDGTWFEAVSTPPVDTPLIELIPVPREER
jgi:hypothetical protein